jgi:hypothetical protein
VAFMAVRPGLAPACSTAAAVPAAMAAASSQARSLFTIAAGGAKGSPPLPGAWHRARLLLVPIVGCALTRAGAECNQREE